MSVANESSVEVLQVSLLEWLGCRSEPSPACVTAPPRSARSARTFSPAEREEACMRAERRRFAQDLEFRTR